MKKCQTWQLFMANRSIVAMFVKLCIYGRNLCSVNQYSDPKIVHCDLKQLVLALALAKAKFGPDEPQLVAFPIKRSD